MTDKWRIENPAKYKAGVQRYESENRIEIRERAREHYRRNREKIRERNKKWRDANPELMAKHRERSRRITRAKTYGLTLEQYDRLLDEYPGYCGICQTACDKPVFDHDHRTNRVRGLICKACNFALGFARDKVEILRNGARYLMGFDLLIKELKAIDFDAMVISEAIETRKILQEALRQSEEWFKNISVAFDGKPAPQPRPVAIPAAAPPPQKASPATVAKPNKKNSTRRPPINETVKRGRGRPRKVTPELVARTPAETSVVDVDDHSGQLPVAVLNGSSFLPPGERPNNIDQLPPGHPRAGGGSYA